MWATVVSADDGMLLIPCYIWLLPAAPRCTWHESNSIFSYILAIKDFQTVSLFRRNWNSECPALFTRSEWKAKKSGTITFFLMLTCWQFPPISKLLFNSLILSTRVWIAQLLARIIQVLLGLAESIFQEQTSLKKLVELMMSNARNYLHCRRIVIYVFAPSETSVKLNKVQAVIVVPLLL
jgi:hypothetical protein